MSDRQPTPQEHLAFVEDQLERARLTSETFMAEIEALKKRCEGLEATNRIIDKARCEAMAQNEHMFSIVTDLVKSNDWEMAEYWTPKGRAYALINK